ncbi:MAG: hypothetical protein AAFX44_06715 [Pseudomonadota bacterium]
MSTRNDTVAVLGLVRVLRAVLAGFRALGVAYEPVIAQQQVAEREGREVSDEEVLANLRRTRTRIDNL